MDRARGLDFRVQGDVAPIGSPRREFTLQLRDMISRLDERVTDHVSALDDKIKVDQVLRRQRIELKRHSREIEALLRFELHAFEPPLFNAGNEAMARAANDAPAQLSVVDGDGIPNRDVVEDFLGLAARLKSNAFIRYEVRTEQDLVSDPQAVVHRRRDFCNANLRAGNVHQDGNVPAYLALRMLDVLDPEAPDIAIVIPAVNSHRVRA